MKIAIFESIRKVMQADLICGEKGVTVELASIPIEVSEGTNIALIIEQEEVSIFDHYMKENDLTYKM